MQDTALDQTLAAFARGDRRAASRLISLIENGGSDAEAVLEAIYPRLGGVPRLGITGPPGVGKSTLVDALARHHRKAGRKVGIVAVDPTSPFTGGAVLGDRVRMGDLTLDPGVFIRSMATRGSLGGLARSTKEVADVLEALGHDIVLIETVGVGQTEMDIAMAADTVVVVLSPESGDAIQAMKAGLMEVADVLVVNKADRPGADTMVRTLKADLAMRPPSAWQVPVLVTVASGGSGLDELAAAVNRHYQFLQAGDGLAERRLARARKELSAVLQDRLWRRAHEMLADEIPARVERIADGRQTPYAAARELLAVILKDVKEQP
jgi:LAO/AO transport system kinase